VKKMLSIIIPVFNEQGCLIELYDKIIHNLEKQDIEIIFVDDCSTDDSLRILRQLALSDRRIKVLSFKRNFGQTAAIAAGFDIAKGEIFIVMDADLQNDPADVQKLVKLIEEGYDVVSGWRKSRKDNLVTRRIPSFLANKLISIVTKVPLHDYGCSLKAYRRDIVKDIKLYGEMHRLLPALAAWVGAKIYEVEVVHHQRALGRSKYGIGRTIKVLLDLMTVKFLMSYSTKPSYVFGGMGILSFALGFISLAVVLYRLMILKIVAATPLVFLMVVFFITGVQLILMGFLAEILVRINFESQNKPIYYIKEKINI